MSLDGHASGERAVPRATVPSVEGYELLRIVGSGGMGVVYEARSVRTGARVALKTVSTTTQAAATALRREASVLRGLSHPGIVSLLDEGDAHGQPYFVMKLVRGRRLSELLAFRTETLTVLRRLCSTLAALHGQGIVHRDVNPRNILVRGEDQPVLVDFGLAARFAVSESRERIDVAGVTMGTLAYTAPEQLRGELVDPRADLYAVGCILYEVLTGRLPFQQASSSAQMRAHLHEQPVPPSQLADVPPELDELTLGLLAKHPRQRIGYARDVAEVLAKFGARDWAHNRRARPQHYLYRSELMGRKRWLAEAQGKLELCITGRGERIFIAGDSGAGKTRFLSEIATLAVRMGISVVTAECAAMSGDTNSVRDSSLQALRPLLREVADRCREEPELIGPLLAGRGALLAHYEPALRGLEHEPEPPALTQAAARARLLACLRDTLVALAQKKPLLLLFDDLQWMDRLSFELISSLSLSLLAQTRVLIVGAYRAELAAPRLTAA
ncbi:MAG TPA: protein kinase, partial [Polyangiales bacterium]|nr:protein kinase [Polyangiales bacterium]